jgi:hypothetical protein
VLDVGLGLSCSIVGEEVCEALGRSHSLRACKRKRCCSVVNMSRNAHDQGQ